MMVVVVVVVVEALSAEAHNAQSVGLSCRAKKVCVFCRSRASSLEFYIRVPQNNNSMEFCACNPQFLCRVVPQSIG